MQNLKNFNFEETKKKVKAYFLYIENLIWELQKLNNQKGLTTNYDFAVQYMKQAWRS